MKKFLSVFLCFVLCLSMLVSCDSDDNTIVSDDDKPKELISISAQWPKENFDISETAEVEITSSPKDMDLSDLELSDNDIAQMEYQDGTATVTFTDEGTATISFCCQDASSNSVTITVTDKKAKAQRQESQAQSNKTQNEQKQDVAKHDAPKQNKTDQSKDQASSGQSTAQQSASQSSSKPSAPSQSVSSSTTSDQTQSQMVWIPRTGSKYHSNPSCSGMKDPSQVTLSQAQSAGYTPCKKCY